jgi:dolichol-phosphate mannosyltransferase
MKRERMKPMSDDSAPLLTVLLPVHNEGANLPIMLRMLSAFLDFSYEVLVVYDDPNDDTIPVIRTEQESHPNLRGLLNERGRGVGRALAAGVEDARGEYVLFMGVDDIGPVLAIGDMLELMDEGCEFVSSTRYAHGGKRLAGPWIGRRLSWWANRMLPWAAGSVFSDSTDATKMFRRDIFERLDLRSRDVGCVIGFEMAIKAQALGLKLGEVPVLSIDRPFGGHSTFRLIPWFVEYGKWFWRAVFTYGPKMRSHRAGIQVKSSLFGESSPQTTHSPPADPQP